MQTWLKEKYRRNKTVGKYKSSSNDSGDRSRRRSPVSDKERVAIRARQPLVTLVLLPNGKRRFVREERPSE